MSERTKNVLVLIASIGLSVAITIMWLVIGAIA